MERGPVSVSDLGIVGGGRMGRGIARRFATAGHSVLIYDRDATVADAAARWGEETASGRVRPASLARVLEPALIVLAVRYPATLRFAGEHASELAGKVVVDISTPLDEETFTHLVLAPTTSAAEELARTVPESRVVKAFNTNLAVTLPTGEIGGEQLDTFVASDDQHARGSVIAALAGSGLRALDAGALSNSRTLEAMAALGIEIGERYELGQAFGFKYLPAGPLKPPLNSEQLTEDSQPDGGGLQQTTASCGEGETRS
jgi:NADPH-dependent F420 reductase